MKYTPQRLKLARQKAKLSQQELADLSGLSRNTIISIEKVTGKTPELKLNIIAEYERITGVPAEYLIFGEDLLDTAFLRLRETQGIINQTIDRTISILEQERENKLGIRKP